MGDEDSEDNTLVKRVKFQHTATVGLRYNNYILLIMAQKERVFFWYDYVVFFCMLVISLGIGVYHTCKSRKKKTTKEYLMGGRSMSPLPVAMSIVMSTIAAALLMGSAVETYLFGSYWYMSKVGLAVGWLLANFLYVPLFYKLQLTSVFQV